MRTNDDAPDAPSSGSFKKPGAMPHSACRMLDWSLQKVTQLFGESAAKFREAPPAYCVATWQDVMPPLCVLSGYTQHRVFPYHHGEMCPMEVEPSVCIQGCGELGKLQKARCDAALGVQNAGRAASNSHKVFLAEARRISGRHQQPRSDRNELRQARLPSRTGSLTGQKECQTAARRNTLPHGRM